MVKHVFLVEGSKQSDVLECVVKYYNDPDFYFIIHWDKKYKQPIFVSEKHVEVISEHRVFWGTDTQILVEKLLFKKGLENFPNAEWFHLISESDVPLMTKKFFKEFFEEKSESDVEYVGDEKEYTSRIKYFMPIRYLSFKNDFFGLNFHRTMKVLNKIFRVDRLRGYDISVYKGSNWVSLTRRDTETVVNSKLDRLFLHSSLADELYVQTILGVDEQRLALKSPTQKFSRLIDWNRGGPYTFQESNADELIEYINGSYSFVRKIYSKKLAKRILYELMSIDNS